MENKTVQQNNLQNVPVTSEYLYTTPKFALLRNKDTSVQTNPVGKVKRYSYTHDQNKITQSHFDTHR